MESCEESAPGFSANFSCSTDSAQSSSVAGFAVVIESVSISWGVFTARQGEERALR